MQNNFNTLHTSNGNILAAAANHYLQNGCSLIPVKHNKHPDLETWLPYQTTRPTQNEVNKWFLTKPHGIGIVGGLVSGNLVCLDIDCKFDLSGEMMREFCDIVKEHNPELYQKLVIAKTINGGFHILFRVSDNQTIACKKLAQRPATAEELKEHPTRKMRDLIETKSEGGYFLIEPTPGYKFVQGGFDSIPCISKNEKDLLLSIARSFDQMPIETAPGRTKMNVGGTSPFDDYNARADVRWLLEKHGWNFYKQSGERVFFTRPGKTENPFSANYHTGLKVFYVFTTSTDFEAGRGYSPAGVYTILEHHGDFSAAAKHLLTDGFGTRPNGNALQAITANNTHTEPPKPLPDKTSRAVPELDEKLLPESWRVWLSDTSERLQCPPDYAAVSALVACASLIGNRIRVRPKQYDSWLVVPNLWGAIVGIPGVMKTPAVNEGMIFFREIAESERLVFEKKLETAEFEKEFNEAKKSALKKEMAKAKAGEKEKFQRQFQDLQAETPKEKRLWTADVTVEKLGELLNENPDGLLILRDELTGWFRMLERSGHEQDRAFYLEAWNGEGTFTFDRIGRGKIHVKNLTVSVLGTIQPAMIEPYLKGSIDGSGDDGLIQRFQLLVYPETLKTYRYVDQPPKGREQARESFKNLYSLSPESVGAKRLTDDAGGYSFLQFDEAAQGFFKEWLTELESDLRSDAFDTSALESHLAKYRSLMPTLSLIFHLLDRIVGNTESNLIGLTSAELSAAWCSYLQKHAEKLYSLGSQTGLDTAREILKRIESKQVSDNFTAREIYNNHWKSLSNSKDVEKGLDVLEDYGYVFPVTINNGGRPKTIYTMHESLK